MKCKNCGKENEDQSNFCSNCGQQLQGDVIQKDNPKDNNQTKNSSLSWISLGLLIWQIIIFIISNFVDIQNTVINFIFKFPWILAALILTIVSRCIYKDSLSKYLLITEIVLIAIAIILIIIGFLTLMTLTAGCIEYTQTNTFMEWQEEVRNGCASMG